MRDIFFYKVFSSLSPCWFFIRGGGWRKPLTNVPYKRTFGTPDQDQTLDLWGWHPADVNSEVAMMLLCRELTTSARHEILNMWRYCRRNQCNDIRSHGSELNDVSNPTPILYVESSTWCGFFLSWPCVPTPNVRLDIWDPVESYVIHMFLARRLKITFTSNLKLIISFLVLHILLLCHYQSLSFVASTRHAQLTSRVCLRLAIRPGVQFANLLTRMTSKQLGSVLPFFQVKELY